MIKLEQRSPYFYLGLIVLLTAVLRIPAIGRDSLWYDEAVSYLTANWPLTTILSNAAQDPHPPFYYSLLHFWFALVPEGDVSGRVLSLLLNGLLIPVVYLLCCELFSRPHIGLIAAFLTAVSPFHILYSHELRMYTLLMLLTVLAILFLLYARRTNAWYWWALFAITALLLEYTHLFSFFVLTAVALYTLYHHQQRSSLWRTILIGILLILLFLPWINILLGESQAQIGSLRPLALNNRIIEPNPIIPLTTLAFLIFGQAFSLWYVALILFLTISTLVIFLLELRKAKQKNEAQGVFLPLLIICCVIGIPIAIYIIRPFFLPERTMASASPFLFILLAWSATRRGTPLPYLVIASAITLLIGYALYFTGPPLKPPYRDAIQFVAQNRLSTDAVLHTSDGSYLSSLSYVTFPNHAILQGDPDTRKPVSVYEAMGGQSWTLAQAAQKGKRLWLIIAIEHSEAWQREQVSHFTANFTQIETYDFGGIAVILYDLNQ